MTLLPGRIAEVCVTGLSRDKFTMGNIHGYLKKKRETSHDIKRGIKLGCFDTPGQENQSGFFIGQQHEKAKKVIYFKRFLSPCFGKIDVDKAVFTLSKGKF